MAKEFELMLTNEFYISCRKYFVDCVEVRTWNPPASLSWPKRGAGFGGVGWEDINHYATVPVVSSIYVLILKYMWIPWKFNTNEFSPLNFTSLHHIIGFSKFISSHHRSLGFSKWTWTPPLISTGHPPLLYISLPPFLLDGESTTHHGRRMPNESPT